MARGSCLAGIIKSGVLSATLIAGLAAPGYAGDPPKLTLTGSATMVTDYIFRGVSQTQQLPAVQPEFDLTYGIFYTYIWGSNNSFNPKSIELDYGAGITPKLWGLDLNIAALYYTYPAFNSGPNGLDYLEVRTSAAHTFDKWTLSIGNWWSPDNFNASTQSDAIEGGVSYALPGKWWNFFTPSISGAFGYQWYEKEEVFPRYTYWNAGLTLGFLTHWSADVRYWDTDLGSADCVLVGGGRNNCDARAVGTIKATF
jgi:uncharacterized protein (TIGR02001 family)